MQYNPDKQAGRASSRSSSESVLKGYREAAAYFRYSVEKKGNEMLDRKKKRQRSMSISSNCSPVHLAFGLNLQSSPLAAADRDPAGDAI